MGCFRYLTSGDMGQMERSFGSPTESPTLSAIQEQILAALAPAIPGVLRSTVGSISNRLGQIGEEIAGPLVATVLETAPDPSFEKQHHGIDALHRVGDLPVVIEVKTVQEPGSFASHLGMTNDGRQGSDDWVANRGVDPAQCVVIGVEIIPASEPNLTVATIYIREDSEAKSWTPIVENIDIQAIVGDHWKG